MGNTVERAASIEDLSILPSTSLPHEEEEEELELKEEEEEEEEEEENEEKENEDPQQEPEVIPENTFMFHLFSYHEYLRCRKHQVMKMVTSKLILTEELLKQEPIRIPKPSTSYDDDFCISLLSEDELSEDEEDQDNNMPFELSRLKKYRKYLHNLLLDVASEKIKKSREKKKPKRTKRRTLISSKKPSKKVKTHHENWEETEQELLSLQNQQTTPDVIVID